MKSTFLQSMAPVFDQLLRPSRVCTFRFLSSRIAPIALLLCIAVIVRLPLFILGTKILWPDSQSYYLTAIKFLSDGNLHTHQIYHTPLYPLFLSVFLYFGENATSAFLIVAIQHLLGIASVLTFYLFARRMTSPLVSFLTGLLLAVYPLQLYYECVVATEVLFVFFMSLVFYQVSRVYEKATPVSCAILGALCGLATLTRPVAQLYLVCIIFLLALCWPRIKKPLLCFSAMIVVYVAVISPWVIENGLYQGFWAVSRGQGLNLFVRVFDMDGYMPKADSAYPKVKAVYEKHLARKAPGKATYFKVYFDLVKLGAGSFAEVDQQMGSFAREALLQDPTIYFKNTAYALGRILFHPYENIPFCSVAGIKYLCETPRLPHAGLAYKSFHFSKTKGDKSALSAVYWIFGNLRVAPELISVLALFGIAISFFQKGEEGRRLRALSYFSVVTIVYFCFLAVALNKPEDRYRLPVDPLLFLLASIALAKCGSMASQLKRVISRSGPQ